MFETVINGQERKSTDESGTKEKLESRGNETGFPAWFCDGTIQHTSQSKIDSKYIRTL